MDKAFPQTLLYRPRQLVAWLVHLLTASTAIIGLLTLYAIYHHDFIQALWWMSAAIVIDAVDGTFARFVNVKKFIPQIDGALLDNIADYLNYVITPCFFLLINDTMLPASWKLIVISAITLASAYQFTQADAKTPDHFFKGFPCYWNIIVMYLFLFQTDAVVNTATLLILTILVFVPIKYVYPSRLDYLTELPWLRKTMLFSSILYGLVSGFLLWLHPQKPLLLVTYSFAYILFYIGFSIFRTFRPLLSN